jgi:hypothetical protein
MEKFKLQKNQEIVRERKVVLERIRVKEYPEMREQVFKQTGLNKGNPVNVLAEIRIYQDPARDIVNYDLATWPVNAMGDDPVVGMWFACREDWEKDEEEFKAPPRR